MTRHLTLLMLLVSAPLGAQSELRLSLPRSLEDIVIDSLVMDELVMLADTSRLETPRCLIGRVEPPNIIVYFTVTPQIFEFARARSGGCSGRLFLSSAGTRWGLDAWWDARVVVEGWSGGGGASSGSSGAE